MVHFFFRISYNLESSLGYRDHKFLFHAFTFAKSRGSCLNPRRKPIVQTSSEDLANASALKQTCEITILAFLVWFHCKSHKK